MQYNESCNWLVDHNYYYISANIIDCYHCALISATFINVKMYALLRCFLNAYCHMYSGACTFLLVDVNECASNNDGCSDHCSNSPGSFSCYCRQYADLHQDRRHCNCRSGFTQNDAALTCDGEQERIIHTVHVLLYASM